MSVDQYADFGWKALSTCFWPEMPRHERGICGIPRPGIQRMLTPSNSADAAVGNA